MTSIDYLDLDEAQETSRGHRYQMERLIEERDVWKQACNDKDKLIAIISHDIKGQLGGINGLIEILELEGKNEDSSAFQTYLALLKQSSANLFQLLENLLQWSRMQTWTIQPQNQEEYLFQTLNNVFELNQAAAQAKQIDYVLICPKEIKVFTDINLVSFIVRNLINNAIKYTSIGGSISIEAIAETEGDIHIKVTNSGQGISPEVHAKLFDAQALISTAGTAKEKGTGLGLLLCLEFAQMLGTSLHIHSEEGHGTTCSFFVKAV
jgi:signal transduction histidine kinase